jgi:hypothetical protein
VKFPVSSLQFPERQDLLETGNWELVTSSAMNRRDFLSSVAVVPALAVRQTPQQPPAVKPGPHGLKLGTVTYNIA